MKKTLSFNEKQVVQDWMISASVLQIGKWMYGEHCTQFTWEFSHEEQKQWDPIRLEMQATRCSKRCIPSSLLPCAWRGWEICARCICPCRQLHATRRFGCEFGHILVCISRCKVAGLGGSWLLPAMNLSILSIDAAKSVWSPSPSSFTCLPFIALSTFTETITSCREGWSMSICLAEQGQLLHTLTGYKVCQSSMEAKLSTVMTSWEQTITNESKLLLMNV